MDAKVLETKDQSTYIAYKPENSPEEIRLWVNNNIISKSEKDGIYFKNETEISKILDKAVRETLPANSLQRLTFQNLRQRIRNIKKRVTRVLIFIKMYLVSVNP